MYVDDLRHAALNLQVEVAKWVVRALDSGWFQIEPGAYQQGGTADAVCPIVAPATMAGIWRDGHLLTGNQAWGSPESPTHAVEDFAAYFDLCAEELGVSETIRIVRTTLAGSTHRRRVRTNEGGW